MMVRKTARWLVVLAALGLAGLACGGGGAQAPGPAVQPPAQPAQPVAPAPAAPASEPAPAPAAAPQPKPAAPAPRPAAPVTGQPKYGGTLVLPLRQDPPGGWDVQQVAQRFDIVNAGAPVWGVGNLVRECTDNQFKACPGLAEAWEVNSDFTQFTYKVRDNVLWHDGKPFTADDAKFWLELVVFGAESGDKKRPPAFWSKDFGSVQKVEVLPGNRVRVTLKEPARVVLNTMNHPIYHVAHPSHLTEPLIKKGEVRVTPQDVGWIGTGPFRMVKYEKGSRALVQRFDRYWEKDAQGRQLPYLDGMEFAVMRDPSAMHAAIRVGRLDGGTRAGGYYLTREQKAGYLRDLGDKVWFAELAGGTSVDLGANPNLLKPGPLQDVRVRKAIQLWMDRPAAIEAIYGGFGVVGTLLPPKSEFTNPDFLTWPGFNSATKERDRAEAKRLMAEAGFPSGFKATYNCNRSYLDRCEYHIGQFAGLGIELKLDLQDPALWTRSNLSLDYDFLNTGGAVAPLPEAWEFKLTRYSISNAALAKHEDPKLPEFFARLKRAASYEERVRIWREIERYVILEQAYLFPYASQTSVAPYRSYVKGMFLPADGTLSYIDFATVWLDK